MTEKEILFIYKKHKALLKGHFLLSSGLHSDTYLQSALVMQYPFMAEKIMEELAGRLYHINFDTVVSPAIGGIRFGYELARALRKKSIFTERLEGNMALRRGFDLKKDEKIIIAEDVITTGKSTKEVINVVENHGAKVVGVTCLVDRSGGLAKYNVPLISLVKVDVKTYDATSCPLCKEGVKITKPGSR